MVNSCNKSSFPPGIYRYRPLLSLQKLATDVTSQLQLRSLMWVFSRLCLFGRAQFLESKYLRIHILNYPVPSLFYIPSYVVGFLLSWHGHDLGKHYKASTQGHVKFHHSSFTSQNIPVMGLSADSQLTSSWSHSTSCPCLVSAAAFLPPILFTSFLAPLTHCLPFVLPLYLFKYCIFSLNVFDFLLFYGLSGPNPTFEIWYQMK